VINLGFWSKKVLEKIGVKMKCIFSFGWCSKYSNRRITEQTN